MVASSDPVKCTIIIPTWNRAYILADALESALAQEYTDYEILIIDDGSSDNTGEVIQRYREPRLRYIRHPENKGYSAACNTGFREARGELVSFLDSDDLWRKDKLAIEVEFLDRHREAAAVFSDLAKEDGATVLPSFMRGTLYFLKLLTEKNYPREVVFTQREMYLCLLREVPIKPTALTMRRCAIAQVGYFEESWPSGSDWEFLIRFSRILRFGYIDQCLACLRVQTDATHRMHAVKDKSMILDLLKSLMIQNRHDPEARDAAKWGYTDITKHLAWTHLANGHRWSSARSLAYGSLQTGDLALLTRSLFALLPEHLRVAMKRWL